MEQEGKAEPEAKTEPEVTTMPAKTRSERATQVGTGEQEREPAPEVRIRWDVGAAAERAKAQREHVAEAVPVTPADERLGALVARAREEAAQLLEATVRQAQAAWEADAAEALAGELRKSDLLRELQLFARVCKEAEQVRAAEVSAARPEANQERAAKPVSVQAEVDEQVPRPDRTGSAGGGRAAGDRASRGARRVGGRSGGGRRRATFR